MRRQVLIVSWLCLCVVAGFFVPITMEARQRARATSACANGSCSYQPASYQVVAAPVVLQTAFLPVPKETKAELAPKVAQAPAAPPVTYQETVAITSAPSAPVRGPLRRWIQKRRGSGG